MFLALLTLHVLAAAPNTDPFAFFQPSVTLSMDDRRQLDRGEPIARVLPGQDHEIAVFAAVRVDIDGDRLVAWMRRIEELKKSAYVFASVGVRTHRRSRTSLVLRWMTRSCRESRRAAPTTAGSSHRARDDAIAPRSTRVDNYLVYLNRSEVDVVGGMFGGLVRWLVQRRLKVEAANVLQGFRQRLEGGEPPPIEAKGSR